MKGPARCVDSYFFGVKPGHPHLCIRNPTFDLGWRWEAKSVIKVSTLPRRLEETLWLVGPSFGGSAVLPRQEVGINGLVPILLAQPIEHRFVWIMSVETFYL